MKKATLLPLLLILSAILILPGCASLKTAGGKSGVQLAYKLDPGGSFTLKSEGSTELRMEQMGQEIAIDMASSSESVCRPVAGGSGAGTEMEMEYKAMKQSAKSPMGDSDTDFSSWIGKKVRFNISPQGALSGFSGFDQLPEIMNATGEKVSGELVQHGMNAQFFELPDHPVRIGESWTVTHTQDIPYGTGTLKQEDTSTYTASERVNKDGMDCLKIDVAGTEKLSGEFEQQGMQLELSRDTKTTGVIYFAIDKGMYHSLESFSNATGEVYVPAASITIPQQIKSKMAVTVVFN